MCRPAGENNVPVTGTSVIWGGKWAPVAVLCVYQSLHWFDPSEPYLAKLLHDESSISYSTVYHRVFPWSTFGLLPMSLIAAAVFEVAGHRAALAAAALANLAAVTLMALRIFFLEWDALLYVSELAWAYGFSAIFVVTATFFRLLPTGDYQLAASLSRSTTLFSTVLSSLLGFAMAATLLRWTVAVAFAARVLALALILVALVRGWVPHVASQGPAAAAAAAPQPECAAERAAAPPPPSLACCLRAVCRCSHGRGRTAGGDAELEDFAATDTTPSAGAGGGRLRRAAERWLRCMRYLSLYRDGRVLLWSLWYAALLGVHTLVATYDQSLYAAIAPAEDVNGLIKGVAYATAAAATLALPRLVARALAAAPLAVLAVASAVSSLLLFLMHVAPTIAVAGLAFVCYHAVAEFVLVVGRVQVAKAVLGPASRRAGAPLAAQESGHGAAAGDAVGAGAAPHPAASRVQFALVLGTNTTVGLAMAAALHATLERIGGGDVRAEFLGYALFVVVVTAAGCAASLARWWRR